MLWGMGYVRMEPHIPMVGKHPSVLRVVASGIGWGISPRGFVLAGKLASWDGCAYPGRFDGCV